MKLRFDSASSRHQLQPEVSILTSTSSPLAECRLHLEEQVYNAAAPPTIADDHVTFTLRYMKGHKENPRKDATFYRRPMQHIESMQHIDPIMWPVPKRDISSIARSFLGPACETHAVENGDISETRLSIWPAN